MSDARRPWLPALLFSIVPLTAAGLVPAALVALGLGRLPPRLALPEAAAGAALLLALALYLMCLRAFVVRGRGTPAPTDPPRALVIAGPYRHVRNPMYLAALTAVLAIGLAFRSLAVVGYAALLALGFHRFVVSYEEARLLASFGDAYRAYLAAVPRWRPRLSPYRPEAADDPAA